MWSQNRKPKPSLILALSQKINFQIFSKSPSDNDKWARLVVRETTWWCGFIVINAGEIKEEDASSINVATKGSHLSAQSSSTEAVWYHHRHYQKHVDLIHAHPRAFVARHIKFSTPVLMGAKQNQRYSYDKQTNKLCQPRNVQVEFKSYPFARLALSEVGLLHLQLRRPGRRLMNCPILASSSSPKPTFRGGGGAGAVVGRGRRKAAWAII